jgi:hypothetical protein
MIGFDVEEGLKDLRKNLLWKHHIFTGEAKPAVIRLLPSLALSLEEAAQFTELFIKKWRLAFNPKSLEPDEKFRIGRRRQRY